MGTWFHRFHHRIQRPDYIFCSPLHKLIAGVGGMEVWVWNYPNKFAGDSNYNSKYWNEIYICCRRSDLTNILILESKNVSLFMSLCFCNNLDWVFCAILFFPIFLLKWSHNAYKREIKEILIHWFISIGSAAGSSLAPGSRQPPWAAHRKTWNVVII